MAENVGQRLHHELNELEKRAQLRALDTLEGINLCSNDYLGLSNDPRLRQAVENAVGSAAAVASTGSRLLSGNSRDWEELESDFAEFAGTEAALYFTSGYAANVGLLSSLLQPSDIVFSDSLNHASIIDGIRLSSVGKVIYEHCDLHALRDKLEQHRSGPGARIIVTESVFSMDGDQAPLSGLLELAEEYDAELIVDEAHATGVFGRHGRGLAAEVGIEDQVLAIVHPCGKALASLGGFVCSSRILKQYLVNRARTFIFSTAAPPYMAHQIRAAMHLVSAADPERSHLQAIQELIRAKLRDGGLNLGPSSSQIIPVVVGSNEAALHIARQLQSRGFAVRAIRPPTVPQGTSRLRLSLTSKITTAQASYLVDSILELVGAIRRSPILAGHA